MKEILRNSSFGNEFEETSFIGKIHELGVWDDREYSKLESEVYWLCRELDAQAQISRDFAWPLVRIFSYLMMILGCHLDPNDGYYVKGLSNENIYERRERIQLVFEGVFQGKMPSKEILGY